MPLQAGQALLWVLAAAAFKGTETVDASVTKGKLAERYTLQKKRRGVKQGGVPAVVPNNWFAALVTADTPPGHRACSFLRA